MFPRPQIHRRIKGKRFLLVFVGFPSHWAWGARAPSESLIEIMGNEYIFLKSQTTMSGLAGLEPGNVWLITPFT